MKTLKCKDTGTICRFIVTGMTNAEVKRKIISHTKSVHKGRLENLKPEEIRVMMDNMEKMIQII